MSVPELSLVLIFFNEEGNIRRAVPPLVRELEEARITFQLILVNDGSSDNTNAILEDIARHDPRLEVLHLKENHGKGGAILAGLHAADGKFVGYSDGDGQVAPIDVLRVFNAIRKGRCDLTMANRVIREDGLVRKFISRCYNGYMHLLYRCPVSDHSAGPKIFRRELLSVLDLHSANWFIDPEIMIKAKWLHLKIAETPIVFHARTEGESSVKLRTIMEFVWNISAYPFRKQYRIWKKRTLPVWQHA